MASVTHEIGYTIDLSKGTYVSTEYTNGFLRLSNEKVSDEIVLDEYGNEIFKSEGYWISEEIDLTDIFTDFKNIAKTMSVSGSYKIFTKTSEKKLVWSDWEEVAPDFTILSPENRWLQVKIEFFGNLSDSSFVIEEFDEPDKYSNDYLESENGQLKLKKDFEFKMNKDVSWSDEGTLFRKTIEKTKLKKINSINLI